MSVNENNGELSFVEWTIERVFAPVLNFGRTIWVVKFPFFSICVIFHFLLLQPLLLLLVTPSGRVHCAALDCLLRSSLALEAKDQQRWGGCNTESAWCRWLGLLHRWLCSGLACCTVLAAESHSETGTCFCSASFAGLNLRASLKFSLWIP